MRLIRCITILWIAISFSVAQQMSLKGRVFEDYLKLLDEVRNKNGEILSPNFFKKTLDNYVEAERLYDRSKDSGLKDIRQKLEESKRYAERCLQVIGLANLYLRNTIEARDAALTANAALYAPKLWEQAEKEMRTAGSRLEDDKIDAATKSGAKAQQFYREAELLAIKNDILSEARKEIDTAEKEEAQKFSYNTLMNAKTLLLEAETFIEKNPYEKKAAKEKADKAAYQGRHAAYLARTIKELSKKNENWETLILKFEDILTSIARSLDFEAQFDKGFDQSMKTILAEIAALKASEKELLTQNAQLQERLGIVTEISETKAAILEQQRELEEKIARIRDQFTAQEAVVIYEGEKLIIRLYGLNFPPGQFIIQPEYFSLLTKVQRAINEFPDRYILIEGHTDDVGNPESNKILSERRAEVVKEYLLANMDLKPQQIVHYGLGDQRPVASNRTVEGRAKNRRIDVVISLQEE